MSDEGRYLTSDEIQSVKEIIDFLNDSMKKQEIRITADVIDSNGDKLGRIDFAEAGYVFFLE